MFNLVRIYQQSRRMCKVCLLFGEQQEYGKKKKTKRKQKQGVYKLTFLISQNQSMQ